MGSGRLSEGAQAMQDALYPDYRVALESVRAEMLALEDIGRTRRQLDSAMATWAAAAVAPKGVMIREHVVAGRGERPNLTLRVYRPERGEGAHGVLYFLHGGGYVMGRPSHFDNQCAEIAVGANCVVISPDYRLAPEDPYPAGLDDSDAGLAWVFDNAADLGIDSGRVAVGGTSAGAGLAAALLLRLRGRGDDRVAFQFLEAPMLDYRNQALSSGAAEHPLVWNRTSNERAWGAYLDGIDDIPAEASPALAEDLSGLPPTYISVSALELFRDEAVAYADRLVENGVQVELHMYPNGFHGSPRVAPHAAMSQRWRADAIHVLREAVGRIAQ